MAGMTDTSVRRRGTFLARTLANEPICDEHYRLTLEVEGFGATRPGQFVQLLCRPPAATATAPQAHGTRTWSPADRRSEAGGVDPLLRRPLSLAGRRDKPGDACELDFIYRTIGVGTHWLATVQPGALLSVLGPLGTAFSIPAKRSRAVLIGGGVGIPPLLYPAEALAADGKTVVALNGARTASLLPLRLLPSAEVLADGMPSPCIAEFHAWGANAAVSTDDGSLGLPGTVSELLERWLDSRDVPPEDLTAYTCGPEPMMQAVAEICIARGIACQVSLERHMACGMGTCQSCICKSRADNERGWTYRLCCTDGPVFDAAEIIW